MDPAASSPAYTDLDEPSAELSLGHLYINSSLILLANVSAATLLQTRFNEGLELLPFRSAPIIN